MKKYIFILTPSLILLATYSYAQVVAEGSSSTGQLSAISIVNSDIHPIKSTVRASIRGKSIGTEIYRFQAD